MRLLYRASLLPAAYLLGAGVGTVLTYLNAAACRRRINRKG